jgi:hypothetical protein
MIFAAIGCGVGMFVYGYMLETKASAILLSFFWGWMMFGVLIGGISPMAYGLDAFRDSSNELFMMNMLFKVPHSPVLALTTELYVLRIE